MSGIIQNPTPKTSLKELHALADLFYRPLRGKCFDRLARDDIAMARKWIYIWAGDTSHYVDRIDGTLPTFACTGLAGDCPTVLLAQQLDQLPADVYSTGDGYAYVITMHFYRKKWASMQSFVTIDDSGIVHDCQYVEKGKRLSYSRAYALAVGVDEDRLLEKIVTVMINAWNGQQYNWQSVFSRHGVTIRLGFDLWSAKKIFKDRQDMMTPSGRKRPIIHFVKAHYRRLKPVSTWQRFWNFVLGRELKTTVKTHIRGSRRFFSGPYRVRVFQDRENIMSRESFIRQINPGKSSRGLTRAQFDEALRRRKYLIHQHKTAA